MVYHAEAGAGGVRHNCALGGLRQFAELPEPVRRELEGIARVRSYREGQAVVIDGDKPAFIGCVRQGILRMQKTLADGREHIVGLLVPGDMFGRVFDGPLNFAIEAAADAEICAFSRGPFEAMLERSPELERLVLLNILNELDRARDWMMILANRKVTGRLAGFLLVLCTRFGAIDQPHAGANGAIDVKVPISRADLAHLLGTRPESISRAVHSLADAGMIAIRTPYEFELLDLEGLLAESGEEGAVDLEALEQMMQKPRRDPS